MEVLLSPNQQSIEIPRCSLRHFWVPFAHHPRMPRRRCQSPIRSANLCSRHDNLIKTQLGISAELSSCHTATIGSYFIEGHVPAEDIFKLLTEKPNARGLSVPGMPIGSPGMEMGNNKEPFDTLLVFENGKTQVFNSHAQPPSV